MRLLPLRVLEAHPECTSCEFHHNATSVGIPSVLLKRVKPPKAPGRPGDPVALFIVGDYPGIDEDRRNEPFCGAVGKILREAYLRWITPKLTGPVDFFIGNAVRCWSTDEGKKKALKTCRPHLEDDLKWLLRTYRHVVVVAAGTVATQALWGSLLTKSWGRQGDHPAAKLFPGISPRDLTRITVVCCNNPGVALADPSQLANVVLHLKMVVQACNHRGLPMQYSVHDLSSSVTHPLEHYGLCVEGPVFSLDIETYGSVADKPKQTSFHPIRLMNEDGVRRDDLIESAAITVGRDPTTGRLWQSAYDFRNPKHRALFVRTLQAHIDNEGTIVGKNLPFDVSCLMTAIPEIRWTTPGGERVTLIDAGILSFLECDVRAERSLKDLSRLLGLANYRDTLSLKDGQRYAATPNGRSKLLAYNLLDTQTTLELARTFMELLGGDLDKWDLPTANERIADMVRWWSDSTWLCIEQSLNGVGFSREGLQEAIESHRLNMARRREACAEHGLVLGNGGVTAVMRSWLEARMEAAGIRSQPGADIDSKGVLRCTASNLKMLAEHTTDENTRITTEHALSFAHSSKLVHSYFVKLGGQLAANNGRVYPVFHATPGFSHDEGDERGGTRQGRMTCTNPGLQTNPEDVINLMQAEFGWNLVWYDYKQIELVVASLLSQDPVMLEATFDTTRDRHTDTAKMLFGDDVVAAPDYHVKRQAGKRLNFLVLFRGGATKLQLSLLKDTGVLFSLPECAAFIATYNNTCHKFRSWQDRLVSQAARDRMIRIPISGDHRTFLGSRELVAKLYTPEICNFPVQVIAANLMKSAMMGISKYIRTNGLRTKLLLNVFDSVGLEIPDDEMDVLPKLEICLRQPVFLDRIQAAYGLPERLSSLEVARK